MPFLCKKNAMHLAIRADKKQRASIEAMGVAPDCSITWIAEDIATFDWPEADGYIDLLFETDPMGIRSLLKGPTPIIVSAVSTKASEIGETVVRINGWPGFLDKPIWEAAGEEKYRKAAEELAAGIHHQLVWCPDEPGLVSARVISQIINEAYLALEEGVSTRNEIDIAMQTGTNYPQGPFAWAESIGKKKLTGLLERLYKTNDRYIIAPLLIKEANHE